MKIRTAAALFFVAACVFAANTVHAAEPDTLKVFDAAEIEPGTLPENWKHVLPRGDLVYTNYSVERSIEGRYLRVRSAATSQREVCGRGDRT